MLLQADRRVAIADAAWTALTVPGAAVPLVRSVPFYTPRERDYEAPHHHHDEPALVLDSPSPRYTPTSSTDDMPGDEWRAQVQRAIHDWWADETPHARLDLYEEMQRSQGVPPETDRHLLLRVRRELLRTLTFQEKKAMREMIRAVVLAQPPSLDGAPNDSAAAASTDANRADEAVALLSAAV